MTQRLKKGNASFIIKCVFPAVCSVSELVPSWT
jgi:hypothetical protein